jgi:cytochrome c-type biogenesis protein CcmH
VSASASTDVRSPAASDPARRRGRGTLVAVVAAMAVAVVALVVVASRGPTHPPTFSERVDAIASNLRCPVCQNLSVADSPSEIARDMRAEIGRRLRAGQTPEQIDAFFTAKFGRWILLTPDPGGIGLFAWLTPVLVIAGGGALAYVLVRRRRRPAVAGAGAAADADAAAGHDDGGPRLTDAERAEVQRELDALEENA